MSIEVKPCFVAGTPTMVFEGRLFRGSPFRAYDVSPDGNRFLMIMRGGGPGSAVSKLRRCPEHEELKRLVPTS
jgi:hypothetical protein